MTDYRVLVTGSRDWPDSLDVYSALDEIYDSARALKRERLIVIHGACPTGADSMASLWVRSCPARPEVTTLVTEERHPADWVKYRRKAGSIRNQQMVDAGADSYLAFLMPCIRGDCPKGEPHGSHGTTDCIIRAVKARIPGKVFTR